MNKDNHLAIIDFGSNKLRLCVFDNNSSNLFLGSKNISQNDDLEEYSNSINFLIRDAESKISNHLKNIIVLNDSPDIYSIDLSIKKIFDQQINFEDIYSSVILEANQLIKNCYATKKIIHFIIKKYVINEKEYLDLPHEISGITSLILEIKFICFSYEKYENILELFKKNSLNVLDFYSTSLVKSFKYINFFKDNKFVGFLDIGFERTTIILFINQKLQFLQNIPIGGNHISKDISNIMKLSLHESEALKKTFNKSEIDFSYDETNNDENSDLIKKIIKKNISIDLLKKVVLARIEEIIELSFKNISISEYIGSKENLILNLIGSGSKLFNKNTFHLEDKYNFKEINFYEESDSEICQAGLEFEKNFKDKFFQKFKKKQKKIGFFQKFFNFFDK
tara:strand:+ start:14177 stop:15358 length:1182 start_codon:yes stop_codon:yes gene_type:complete